MEHFQLISGQVTINDEPTKNRLFRFCEKKIAAWLRDQIKTLDPSDAPTDFQNEFKVEFTEEEESRQGMRQISCVTKISSYGTTWKGFDLAADSQQAFLHSLKHMQPH